MTSRVWLSASLIPTVLATACVMTAAAAAAAVVVVVVGLTRWRARGVEGGGGERGEQRRYCTMVVVAEAVVEAVVEAVAVVVEEAVAVGSRHDS